MDLSRVEQNFRLIESAAIAGERCPQNEPFGPLKSGAVRALIAAGRVRSEVYGRNWRVVTILDGPHKGATTALPLRGSCPYLVNGSSRRWDKIAP